MKLDCHTALRAHLRFVIKAQSWHGGDSLGEWFERTKGRARPLGANTLGQTSASFLAFCLRPKCKYFHYCTEKKKNNRGSSFEA